MEQELIAPINIAIPSGMKTEFTIQDGKLKMDGKNGYVEVLNGRLYIQYLEVRVINNEPVYALVGEIITESGKVVPFRMPYDFMKTPYDYFWDIAIRNGVLLTSELTHNDANTKLLKFIADVVKYKEKNGQLPIQFVFCTMGFHWHNGTLLYAQDAGIPPVPGVRYETGYAFQFNPTLDLHDLFIGLTTMSADSEANAAILLFKELGLLQSFFHTVGLPPVNFMLCLCGPSNSGKTYCATAVFSNHILQGNKVQSSFSDTEKGMMLLTREPHPVMLFDDLTVGSSVKALDTLSRMYASGIGRNTSNSNQELVRGVPPQGLGAVTMEFVPKTLTGSALTRLFVVEVSPQSFAKTADAPNVSGYAAGLLDRPDIVGTFDTVFTNYICKNPDKAKNVFTVAYNGAPLLLDGPVHTPRYVTSFSFLVAALMLLVEFGKECCGLTENEAQATYNLYLDALTSLTLKNEKRKAAFDIVVSYLSALLQSINNQTLKLADSREQFNANYSSYDGYWHNDKCNMEIKMDRVHYVTTSYLLQNGIALSASQGSINSQIWQNYPNVLKKYIDRYSRRITVSKEPEIKIQTMTINHNELQCVVD